MSEDHRPGNEDNSRHITRRQVIKAGGIGALGFAFSKPLISTIYPKPAFAQYSPGSGEKPPEPPEPPPPPSAGSLRLIGSEIDVSGGLTTTASFSSLAYNGVDNEYMVVWTDLRNPLIRPDIFGQRVSATGTLLAGNFPVIEFSDAQVGPCVAHNSIDNEYLVAWQTQQPGFFNNALGRRFSNTGTALGGDFFIHRGGLICSMVHNPIANEYLVSGRGLGIRGRRVSKLGAVIGSEIVIATGALGPNGQVAYNPNANEYLATWRDAALNIQGRRISSSGGLLGNVIVISPLFAGSGDIAATVAFDPNNDRFLVVFGLSSGDAIMGQFVSSSGQLIGANFIIDDDLRSGDTPDVTFSSIHNAFVLVLADDKKRIRAQALSADGTRFGARLVIASSAFQEGVRDPHFGSNTQTGDFLVVWTDDKNRTGEDRISGIFGQLIGF